ncbi:MAG: MlaD family protein [Phycisphaerae bacterium]
MKQRNQDLLLGITAIVMFSLGLATFLFLYDTTPPNVREIEIQFRHREGMVPLVKGSPVLLANSLTVGRVMEVGAKQMDTPQGLDTFIIVKALIQNDLKIYKNCKINTNQPAVGGNGYVNIVDLGNPDAVALADDDAIRGLPPESFAAVISGLSTRILGEGGLMDQVEGLLDPESEGSLVYKMSTSMSDVNDITTLLKVQLSPDEQDNLLAKLNIILDRVGRLASSLEEEFEADNGVGTLAKVHLALDDLDRALRSIADMLDENRPVLRETIASVQHTAKVLDEDILAALAREFDRDDPTTLLGKLHASMDNVQAAMNDIEEITTTGKRILVLSEPAIERVLNNITEMSVELQRATAELRLNPSRLIWGPGNIEQQNIPAFNAARDFAAAATAMDATSGRLKALLETAGPNASPQTRQEIQRLQSELRDAFGRFERAEKFLYEEIQKSGRR